MTVYSSSTGLFLREVGDEIVHPLALASDSSGQIYVANDNGNLSTVTTYTRRGKKLVNTISRGMNGPVALAIDAADNLYVADAHAVRLYAKGRQTPQRTIRINGPNALAIDKSQALYIVVPGAVVVYGSDGSFLRRITQGINLADAIAFDALGNAYVANSGNSTVTTYAPGGTTVQATISQGIIQPAALAFDGSGNLYVANNVTSAQGASVTVYAPGSTSVFRTISEGVDYPDALALDNSGDLFVANFRSKTVTEYASGSTSILRTIRRGVNVPRSLLFGS